MPHSSRPLATVEREQQHHAAELAPVASRESGIHLVQIIKDQVHEGEERDASSRNRQVVIKRPGGDYFLARSTCGNTAYHTHNHTKAGLSHFVVYQGRARVALLSSTF